MAVDWKFAGFLVLIAGAFGFAFLHNAALGSNSDYFTKGGGSASNLDTGGTRIPGTSSGCSPSDPERYRNDAGTLVGVHWTCSGTCTAAGCCSARGGFPSDSSRYPSANDFSNCDNPGASGHCW